MCGESWMSPVRMPQFIEAWDVDTIQGCNSTIWRSDPFYFFLFSSAHMNPVILHAAKCTLMFPQTEPPPPHCPSLSFSVSLIPLYFLKLQPHVWGDPRFKRAPWETTPLSAIDFKLQVYEEREQSFREGRWRRVEGEMGRLKKNRDRRG